MGIHHRGDVAKRDTHSCLSPYIDYGHQIKCCTYTYIKIALVSVWCNLVCASLFAFENALWNAVNLLYLGQMNALLWCCVKNWNYRILKSGWCKITFSWSFFRLKEPKKKTKNMWFLFSTWIAVRIWTIAHSIMPYILLGQTRRSFFLSLLIDCKSEEESCKNKSICLFLSDTRKLQELM